jgi:hypothetical protein
MSQRGVEIVAELARRFQAGDAEGAFGLFHPGIRIEQPASLPHGGWHRGREGVAAMGAIFASLWERSIGNPRILGCGETVVQVTTQTWTAKESGDRVPEQLGVEVRVDVDEPGRDQPAGGVDLAFAAVAHLAHHGDPVTVDRDVGPHRVRAGPVGDVAVPDHDVMHGSRPRINKACTYLQ